MKTATATEAIVDTPSTKTTSNLTGQLHSYPHRYFGDGGGSGVIAQLQRLDHGQPVLAPVEVRVVAVDLEQLTSGAPARLGAHESVRKGTPTGAESVLHPHTYREATQAERDATTIANQNALIRQLERRVRAQRRIQELETLVGYEKVALIAEIERLRQARRQRQIEPTT